MNTNNTNERARLEAMIVASDSLYDRIDEGRFGVGGYTVAELRSIVGTATPQAAPTAPAATPGDMSGTLESAARRRFLLAGNAYFTIRSVRTGKRFTFRVRAARGADDHRHFVGLLTGSDNDGDYTYLGTIFDDGARYSHGRNSSIDRGAPGAVAFAWLWNHLDSDGVEFIHSGRCGRCGRRLTVPESVAAGLGPECAGRV